MRLKRSVFLAVLALLPVVLAGCGGGGDDSPVAGRYQGPFTFNSPQGNQVGTIDATIDNNGTITGTAANITTGRTATLTGTLNDEGQIQTTYSFPGNIVVNASGPVGFNAAGHLVGTLPATIQGSPFGTINFELTRQ